MGDDEMLVEFRHSSWYEEDIRDEVLVPRGAGDVARRRRRAEGGGEERPADTAGRPADGLRPFHGRNEKTWNARGGSAGRAVRLPLLEDELREWVEPRASSPGRRRPPTPSSTTTTGPRATAAAAGMSRRERRRADAQGVVRRPPGVPGYGAVADGTSSGAATLAAGCEPLRAQSVLELRGQTPRRMTHAVSTAPRTEVTRCGWSNLCENRSSSLKRFRRSTFVKWPAPSSTSRRPFGADSTISRASSREERVLAADDHPERRS